MATNLHALIRYKTIDDCLSRRNRLWKWENLALECGNRLREMESSDMPDPSRKTIFNDIKNMKSGKLGYEAPIKFDKSKSSYIYTDPNFSITNSPLNSKDLTTLSHAVEILKHFSSFVNLEDISEIQTKLEYHLQTASNAKEILQIDQRASKESMQWLPKLYQATLNEKCLRIDYQPFNQDKMTIDVSPLLLKEYNNRWFLFGYSHELENTFVYALDRIKRIIESKLNYYYPNEFSASTYFNHMVGVSKHNGIIETVVIRSNKVQSDYIITKPLHSSQIITNQSDDFVEFSYQLIINYELESLLLSYGEHIEVLEPGFLGKKLKERMAKALEA